MKIKTNNLYNDWKKLELNIGKEHSKTLQVILCKCVEKSHCRTYDEVMGPDPLKSNATKKQWVTRQKRKALELAKAYNIDLPPWIGKAES